MKLLVKHWNRRYAGNHVTAVHASGEATLCGYRANRKLDQEPFITHLVLAFTPDERCEYPVGEVSFVGPGAHASARTGANKSA